MEKHCSFFFYFPSYFPCYFCRVHLGDILLVDTGIKIHSMYGGGSELRNKPTKGKAERRIFFCAVVCTWLCSSSSGIFILLQGQSCLAILTVYTTEQCRLGYICNIMLFGFPNETLHSSIAAEGIKKKKVFDKATPRALQCVRRCPMCRDLVI